MARAAWQSLPVACTIFRGRRTRYICFAAIGVTKHRVAARLVAALMVSGCTTGPSTTVPDTLAVGFAEPPAAAKPRTWWHWMNGNITAEGAKRDLEWMHRSGIGGVQVFEGSLGTPRSVEKPLIWMSPEWKDAMRQSVSTAQTLGLEFTIASSPGWSASGAPFVVPDDAMKKLVWSQVDVQGNAAIRLPRPPDVAGPFQDIAAEGVLQHYYRDVAVLAFPLPAALVPLTTITSQTGSLDTSKLQDGRFDTAVGLPFSTADNTATLSFSFAQPTTIASVVIGLDAPHGFGAPPAPIAVVEVSDDGKAFREVARLTHNPSNVLSASFVSVTVRAARIRLIAQTGGAPPIAPGVAPLPSPPPISAARVTEANFERAVTVNHWPEKGGFAAALDYSAIATASSAGADAIPAGSVKDLTNRLTDAGELNWTPPPGRWRVLRFGYSLTGKHNGPAPEEATGLEVDKLDAAAVSRYADHYLALYANTAGQGRIGGLLSDSIEAGNQNWTPGMIAAFRRLRGYDPTPWLPTLTGIVIGDTVASDKFLWDYRRTISDLLTESHYAVLARKAHDRGMTYYAEALEDHRPVLGDDLAIRAQADVPMGAMWWSPAGVPPRTTLVADIQGAASVANIYGKPFVAAESLTAFGHPFALAPRDLKSTVDLEFALGVNRVVIHTSPHQPLDAAPGFALSPWLGQNFSRLETWADMAGGWTRYIARSSWLLQQGRHAADIAYFIGEERPVTALYGDVSFDRLPTGYGYDFVGPDGLANALSVEPGGTLLSRGGVRYRLLVLGGDSKQLTLNTLKRIETLVNQGATVVGTRPESSPSLSDDPLVWNATANRIWNTHKIFTTVPQAIAGLNLTPDWSIARGNTADVAVQHRTTADADIWFIANRTAAAVSVAMSFRTEDRIPEFWDAVTGRREPAPFHKEGSRVVVPLDLENSGSTFIVFRTPSNQNRYIPRPKRTKQLQALNTAWTLTFGGKASLSVSQLKSWTYFADPAVRYFSGVGVYTRNISVEKSWLKTKKRIFLDLGDVGAVAQVSVDGKAIGDVWTKPYRIELTGKIHTGLNILQVKVANSWMNRLIGDQQTGTDKVTTTYGPSYTKNAPLVASGLLGPVAIYAEEQ